MVKISSREAQKRFGELIDTAQHEPVEIRRYGRRVAVIISSVDYDEMERLIDAECVKMVEHTKQDWMGKEETRKFIEEQMKRADS